MHWHTARIQRFAGKAQAPDQIPTLTDSSDKNLKNFTKAMDKMFKTFPPKKR